MKRAGRPLAAAYQWGRSAWKTALSPDAMVISTPSTVIETCPSSA
jgi:uncharacterized Fe-S cluster protein YjdI